VADRPFDVVILGATGFAGRQAVGWMKENGAGVRWAVAGRNRAKLDALGVESLVVDTTDAPSVDRMVGATKVVASTAGPFLELGMSVVDACVRHGTHYADISGEPPWTRSIIDRFHAAASASGTAIVPSCGFDSVPSDLGAWLVVRQLRAHGEGTRTVEGLFRARGAGWNGGTLATARLLARQEDRSWTSDPHVLEPERKARAAEPASTTVERDASGAWKTAFVMAATNRTVVFRSAALAAERGAPYGASFTYDERLLVSSALRARTVAIGTAIGAALPAAALDVATRLMGPAPGGGPSEEQMEAGWFRTDFHGTGEGGARVHASMDSPGDPGNRSTVRMLCCAALCLLDGPSGGGILTPAIAFGDRLVERLRAHGVRIDVTDG
jgi:short subunit dehydrogenase-like uncharacterized protein